MADSRTSCLANVDAGEDVAGFRVQQVAHGLLDVDGHAEFVEARLDVVALGIGDGDGRIGHGLVDDAGELAFGLAHDADVAESDTRGDAVLEIPVRAEECGHQQHQQCADDAERDDHAALRVLRLGRGHALAQRGVIGRVHGDRGEGDGRDIVRGGTLRGKG